MITKENFSKVLEDHGFVRDPVGVFYKREYNTCLVAVDFDNKKIIYPEDKGLKVNDKTTSNFEHPENFVVLECVCRLLKKGYRPEHIELEPRWTLGHDAKGGKADILVKDDEGNALLIIECKTAGAEFNKEKKNTEEDGGQLFSYWQQENSTRWLALYASDWNDDGLKSKCLVISCKDDANIVKMAEKDKDVKIYNNARNDKERFEVWDETYQKQWLDDVVFNEESQAYRIGVPPLRKGKLKDFTPDDHIVNRFEEILRHNNVSDKENAFNRLVALFICKLVDEIKKQDEDVVDFQYKQGQDTYESLQDRLQHLHQQGMEEFMKEKIYYVEADYAENLFKHYTGRQREAAIDDLNRTIRILKFYSNNDFTFKDVHNEELFYQNGKILVEVVKLFQPYRIVYPNKHQFLGDLFEQLLTKGFKQNEGQFFTPIPITRFIWDSIPIHQYIQAHGLPRIIDYACGAGHFLTESVEAINSVLKNEDNSWVEKHIYGIEKDYRLARVSKISMFMNGAGGSNIIFGDGLENYPEKGVSPASFDILVANPPYSVKGFKQHLKLKQNAFTIVDRISNDGDEIEMLFVERIAQLLIPGGLAAVVLPSSILSNESNSCIAAREQLLSHFMIHAIVGLGSKTFGATPTTTVILFLEKYKEPPCYSELAKDVVNGILYHLFDDDWEDSKVFDAYIDHQGIEKEKYYAFLNKTLKKEEMLDDSYLNGYVEAFRFDSIKYPKKYSKEDKERYCKEKFYNWALEIEKEKLYYFSLIYQQQTVIITSPTDNKEQKEFLGYEWSDKKGAEGIKEIKAGGKLFNALNRFAEDTLAFAVRNSFLSTELSQVNEEAEKYIKQVYLKDIIDFSHASFVKSINTSTAKRKELSSKYPLVFLSSVAIVSSGNSAPQNKKVFENGKYPFFRVSDVAKYHLTTNLTESNDYLNEDGIKKLRLFPKGTILFPKSGASTYLDHRAIMGVDGYVVSHLATINILPNALIKNRYLYEVLTLIKAKEIKPDSGYPSLNISDIESIRIPLPPIGIQEKIISECDRIYDEFNSSRMNVEVYQQRIAEVFDRLEVMLKQTGGGKFLRINELCELITNRTVEIDMETYITTDNMLQNCEGIRPYDGSDKIASAIAYRKGDILLSNIRPYLKKIWQADRGGSCSPDVLVLRPNTEKVDERFLYYSLRRDSFFDFVMNEAGTRGLKMPRGNKDGIIQYRIILPDIEEQIRIVDEISHYDALIAEAKIIMAGCDARRRAIIDKYLT